MGNAMDKLKQLVAMCKCEVNVTVNEHTIDYQTVKQYLADRKDDDTVKEIPEKVREVMEEENIMVWVSAYPDTPIGFFSAYDFNVEAAIDRVLESMIEYKTISNEGK